VSFDEVVKDLLGDDWFVGDEGGGVTCAAFGSDLVGYVQQLSQVRIVVGVAFDMP